MIRVPIHGLPLTGLLRYAERMALTNAEHQKLWRERRRRENDLRCEADAEAYIEQLHGIEQDVAVLRLVALGPARFVAEIARKQRRGRLRELRKPKAEPALSPVQARVRAMRKAQGLDVD